MTKGRERGQVRLKERTKKKLRQVQFVLASRAAELTERKGAGEGSREIESKLEWRNDVST